jgi:hypothetical protein
MAGEAQGMVTAARLAKFPLLVWPDGIRVCGDTRAVPQFFAARLASYGPDYMSMGYIFN